jgi:hypothetical protein
MITLEQSIKVANYQITGGSKYLWKSFGPNARYLDFSDNSKTSFSVIFDYVTQEVYIAQLSDYTRENHYMMINPSYREEYIGESQARDCLYNQVYDDVLYCEIDDLNDFMEKADAILNGKDYDERVSVPLEMSNDELFKIMLAAHKEDITLNQFIEKAIRNYID